VQATDLTRDLAALVSHLMRSAGGTEMLQALEDNELSLSQMKTMHILFNCEEELSIKDIAERLGLSLPAVSRSVEAMVGRGLLTRTEDSEDRRMKRVGLTAEGKQLVRGLIAVRVAGLQTFTDSLSGAERESLERALDVLLERPEVAALRPEASPDA
jgi:DNA-binding MarR family transcriptional regulator